MGFHINDKKLADELNSKKRMLESKLGTRVSMNRFVRFAILEVPKNNFWTNISKASVQRIPRRRKQFRINMGGSEFRLKL